MTQGTFSAVVLARNHMYFFPNVRGRLHHSQQIRGSGCSRVHVILQRLELPNNTTRGSGSGSQLSSLYLFKIGFRPVMRIQPWIVDVIVIAWSQQQQA